MPAEWLRPDRRFFIEFGKVGHYAAVLCNGRKMGEHYGQFSPFEVGLGGALRAGDNEIAVYVHDASGRHVRSGPPVDDLRVGASYRPGARGSHGRNWIGIVGDVALTWRPEARIDDVFVVTSVREDRLEARFRFSQAAVGSDVSIRAAVLDDGAEVLSLSAVPVSESRVALARQWSDAVLWGHPPYGRPKLYRLRAELVRDGRVVDRTFTRFGFREVWVEGERALLNGRRLWMVGTYGHWLDARRYVNDRRPMAAELRAMQQSGLNMLNGHWDDLGETYLDLCDEMGVLVHAAFYCNSQLSFQPRADEQWTDWMVDRTRRWTRARRNHPSIVTWRPFCGLPKNLSEVADPGRFRRRVSAALHELDGTRPRVDRTDVWDHNQGMTGPDEEGYDDGSGVARTLEQVQKPLLTVEIWGGFSDTEGVSGFFRDFYSASYRAGSTGFIPQHLPFFESPVFRPRWLSASGVGNRPTDWRVRERCVNWCDPSTSPDERTPYGRLFAELYRKHVGRSLPVYEGAMRPEVLVEGLRPGEAAFLVPDDPAGGPARGVVAADNGTAWLVAERAGRYRLATPRDESALSVQGRKGVSRPGYDYVQRVDLAGRENQNDGQ